MPWRYQRGRRGTIRVGRAAAGTCSARRGWCRRTTHPLLVRQVAPLLEVASQASRAAGESLSLSLLSHKRAHCDLAVNRCQTCRHKGGAAGYSVACPFCTSSVWDASNNPHKPTVGALNEQVGNFALHAPSTNGVNDAAPQARRPTPRAIQPAIGLRRVRLVALAGVWRRGA